MKIVFITELNPFPPMGGDTIRTFNLLKTLSGFASLHLVILDCEGDIRKQRTSNNSINFPIDITYLAKDKTPGGGLLERLLPRKDIITKLKEIALNLKPESDIIWLDYRYLAHYKQAFPGFKVIYGTQNIQSEIDRQLACMPHLNLLRKIYAFLVWKASEFHEKKYFARCDVLIPVSEEDFKSYSKFIPVNKLEIINNFVDLAHYPIEQLLPQERKKRIVFTGSMDAFQNQRAGDYLLDEVWPKISSKIPDCELFIVGKNPPLRWKQIVDKNITVTGKVDSTIEYIQTAQVAIVPVLDGSGTRYKIIEAMACYTPVVSTPLGCQGLNVKHNVNIIVAESAEDLTQQTIELLNSPEKQVLIASNGYQIVKQNYSVEANTKFLEKLCHGLLEA